MSCSHSFGSSSKHAEIGPESFGIVVCRLWVPCGGMWAWFGPALGPSPARKSKIPGRILKSFRGPLSSAEMSCSHSHRSPSIVLGGALAQDRRRVPCADEACSIIEPIDGQSLAVHWQFGILILGPVFGRFSAKLGPKTPLERRRSSCSAGCTKNQPRRPILRPSRCNSEF